ncbi:MAG: hypothetical protein N2258_03195 [Brevinematales bacterium]|nr:hypothetical protein [Brevinematales bacterium]
MRFLCLFLFVFLSFSFNILFSSIDSKPIAVIGFVDINKKDPDINIVLTRTLVSFLSRFPNSRVISFSMSYELAKNKGFYDLKQTDNTLAIKIGQNLSASLIIFGHYIVSPESKDIRLEIVSIDIVTGQLLFKRRYTLVKDSTFLDTIDDICKDVAGLISGRVVSTAELTFKIENTTNSYELFISGVSEGVIKKDYKKRFPVNSVLPISLKRIIDNREVFTTNVQIADSSNLILRYEPSTSFYIQSEVPQVNVLCNGKKLGIINSNEIFKIEYLPVNTNYNFFLQNEKLQTDIQKILPREGDPVFIKFDTSKFYNRISYRGVDPLWNFMLPGIAQFKANDYKSSILFGGLLVLDLFCLGYSIYGYMVVDDILKNDTRENYKLQVAPYRDFYSFGMIASGVGYISIGLISWLQADIFKAYEEKNISVEFSYNEIKLGFKF